MSYSSFNPYVGNYPVAQTNNPQAYYNQPRNNVQGYSQAQYNQTTYYPQQQVPSYYDRREVSTSSNYGTWSQQQVPSPREAYYYGFSEVGSCSYNRQQALTLQTPYNWPVQGNVSSDYSPQSNSSAPSLPSPPAGPRPVADKKEYVVTEEEKRSSTLWRMLHEIDSVEELARNMTGSRPLAKLSVDDVDRFEASNETNVPMLTDDLIINIPPDSVGIF